LLTNATNVSVTISASGSYTYYASTVNSTLGCESPTRTAVTVTSLPELIATPAVSPAAVCPGSNVSLSGGVSRSGKSTVNVSIPLALFSTTNANSPLTVSGFSAALNNTSVKINFVKVNITHSSVAALKVRLVAPDASVFNLTNQTGSGANFTNTMFQTGGAALSSGTAPYTGIFAPQQAFSNFNGKNPNGTWTLNVQNVGTILSPAGNIISWEINFIDGNGITYSWTSTPPGFTSALQNPSSVLSQSTNFHLSVNGPGGCTTNSSVTANASPLPVAQISSNAPVCEGIALTLFGDNSAVGQTTGNTWSWNGPSFSSSSQNPTLNSTSVTNSGTYVLTVTNNFGCTASVTADMLVNPNPVLAIGTQINVSCNGLSDGQVDIDATNGTAPYLFDLVGPSTPDGIFSGLTQGVYTATVNDDNGCVATPLNVTITEPAVLTVTAGSNNPVCIGTSLNLSATPSGGTSGYSYLWTGPNGPISAVQNPIIAAATAADAGNYSVQVTDANSCTAISANYAVQVTPLPSAALSLAGSAYKCLGQQVTLSLTMTGTSPWACTIPAASYDGVTDSTFTILSSPANINITPATGGAHTYAVSEIATIGCPPGGTSSGSATAYISTAPPTPVSGPVPVGATSEACVNTVMLITSNTITGQNIFYSWNTGSHSSVVEFSTSSTGPWSAGPFQTTTNQVYAKFGTLGSGLSGYYVCLQGVNGCGSTINKCLWVRGVVSGPGSITPPDGVVACENTTELYSCGLSAGATVYTWTLNGSAAAVSPNGGNNPTNVSVTFPTGFTTGQLCVTAALACGGASTSPSRCININKNPANPTVITGVPAACPGTTGVSYSIPAVLGASGYNWTVPANATIVTGANSPSITVDFPTPFMGSHSVCVTATSTCGASAAKCKTVVSGIPNQPAGITGPLANVCGSTIQYSVVSPPGGLTYTWTNPAGTTISGSATGSTILLNISPTFTSGFLTVAANSALCAPATSATRTSSTFWGRPNNPGAITQNPPGAFCSGSSLNFSVVNPVIGPVPIYTWTSSNGAITSLQGPNNVDVTWGTTAAGTITVRAGNSCGLSAGTGSQVFTPAGCREEDNNILSSTAFSVYPNPAHDKITVSIDVNEQTGFNLKLRDMSGRIILSEDRQAGGGLNAYSMDLKGFAKGIYMLEVQSANDKWKTKVIIE
jgi:subtilisin-like proprotein convertase family protein